MGSTPPPDRASAVGRSAIGGISRIQSSRNASGFEPQFTIGRELRSDELAQLRADIAFIRDHSTNSPAAEVSRISTRLLDLHGQTLAVWRMDESQPGAAHVDGLTNLLQALGEQALKVPETNNDPSVVSTATELSNRQFSLSFSWPSGVPTAAIHVLTPTANSPIELSELVRSTTNKSTAIWLAHLLKAEQDLRLAISRVRMLVAPVLDGAPALFRLTEDGEVPPNQPTYDPIDLEACALCIQHIQTAHAYRRDKAAPLAETATSARGSAGASETGAEQWVPSEAEPPQAAQAETTTGEELGASQETLFDANLLDLTLMAQGLLDSCSEFQANWSRALSDADKANPRFTTMLSAFGSVVARMANETTNLLTQLGVDTRLPAFPTPVAIVHDLLTTDDLERRHLGRSLATIQVVHDLMITVRSFQTAMLAGPASPGSSERFWDDGAFHNFLLRFDYLVQALLQESTTRSMLIADRLQPTLQLKLADNKALSGPAVLTMTVHSTGPIDMYASLANSSMRRGDYIATIFHARNFLRAHAAKHGPLFAELAQRGVGADLVQHYGALADLVDQYVTDPTYDVAQIVHLAASVGGLLEILRTAPVNDATEPDDQ